MIARHAVKCLISNGTITHAVEVNITCWENSNSGN